MNSFGKLLALLLCLVLLSLPASAITEVSLTASVSIAPDGSGHVTEKYSIFLDTDREVEEFTHFQSFGQNTITGWRKFVPRLRYHIGGPASPSNAKIFARRVLDISLRSAVVELEYDLNASLFSQEKVGGRMTRYSFEPSFLSFESTATGEVILSPLDTLEFLLPTKAKFDSKSISPRPAEVSGETVRWTGPVTSWWQFSYVLEKALEDEVSDFFKELSQTLAALVPSLLPIALVLLVAAFLFNKLVMSRK